MQDKYSNIPLNLKEKHLEQVREYTEELYKTPELRSLFIEMTLNCNEHCRHCGSNCGDVKMENQLSDSEILGCLAYLATKVKKKPFLNITGGEPLLRPAFIELMHKITELGYHWGVTSNGILIDEEMIEKLHYAGMKTVSISIDGLKETHDWFRQTTGGYDKAMKAIKLLVNGNFKNVMVTTVVHKRNINELDELYKIMKTLGIDIWRIINVEPIGRAKTNLDIRLDDADYVKMLDFIKVNREKENDFEICFGCNHWLGAENEHKFRDWYYRCSAGLHTAGIFYNGDIGGCLDIERKPETIQGNIRKDDLLDVWQNKFEIFRHNRANNCLTCSECSEKDNCRGGGFHTWNLDENKPEICMYNIYNRKEN